ncbi:serpentine type 7TM GPCR chemoreceptor srv domain-containing protein [Ditylenchus destructor]|nr:serpentine type 7TM GPCR chemoreceptor srv domain-containing protein [Ditylenchus destructor]
MAAKLPILPALYFSYHWHSVYHSLHIEVIILLVYRQSFRSYFFYLFIARFITNFLNYFCSFLYVRFGRVGLFYDFFDSLPRFVLAISFFVTYYSFHADNFSTLFILLNRLTLILVPFKHNTIWKYLFPVSILIIFLAPLSFTYQTLGYDFYIRHQDDNWTFTMDFRREEGKTYIRSVYLCAISAVLFCVICGVLNTITVIFYNRNNRKFNLSGVTKNNAKKIAEHKVESRLTMYAIITFVAQLFMAVYNILKYWSSGAPERDSIFLATVGQYGWVNDLCTIVVPSFCLIWASSSVRIKVLSVVRIRRQTQEELFTKKSSKPDSEHKIVVVTMRSLYNQSLE